MISGASVSGAGRSGTTGSSGKFVFDDISFGTYTFTASKNGYLPGSGKGSISADTPSATVTIYLTPIPAVEEPDPTTGSITVYVKDGCTGANISGATISGDGSG